MDRGHDRKGFSSASHLKLSYSKLDLGARELEMTVGMAIHAALKAHEGDATREVL